MHWICVEYTIFYLNTFYIKFNKEEEKEMCTDFFIILGIKQIKDIFIIRREIKDIMGSHKKRPSFGHCPKVALPPPPLILDICEVTFVSAHFGQP